VQLIRDEPREQLAPLVAPAARASGASGASNGPAPGAAR
jgi:hypothetical protein